MGHKKVIPFFGYKLSIPEIWPQIQPKQNTEGAPCLHNLRL